MILLSARGAIAKAGLFSGVLASMLTSLTLAASATGEAGTRNFDIWPAENWNRGSVSAILQTTEGYLWIGTYNGLVRYDGVHFTSFQSGNTPSLCNSRITSLYQSFDGTLWIGHETGDLTRFRDGVFEPVDLKPNWPRGAIEAITQDAQQDLWLLNNTGVLFRIRDGHQTETPSPASASRKAVLTRQLDGTLWIAVNGTIAKVEAAQAVTFRFPDQSESDYFQLAVPARNGGMWIMKDGRIRNWHQDGWAADLGDCPCGPGSGTVMMETSAGMLLVGSISDGLFVLSPDAPPLHFTRTNGLSHNWIRAVAEDHEGNIWIGTGAGLDMLRPSKVRMVSPSDGFLGCAAMSVAETSDGSFWVGTEGAGMYRRKENRWDKYSEASGLGNMFVWSILETRNQELLVGTWGAGVHRWNGEGFAPVEAYSEITDPVVSLYEARDGALWLGTTVGLYRYATGCLTRVAGPKQFTVPDVRAITEGVDNRLWFGMSGGGLGCLHNRKLAQYLRRDGLPSNFVQALYAEADGTLWIGTSDAGLCRWKNGVFSPIGADESLPATVVCHIVDDAQGNLWISTHEGIFRAAKSDLNACAEDIDRPVSWMRYGKSEGLTTPNCSGGFQPGARKLADGDLCFPTTAGLACIDPVDVSFNPVPPPVVIERLLVDGKAVASEMLATPRKDGHHLEISPGKQRFEFHFTGLSFAAPEKVRFKYQLAGLENDWTESEKRSVQYSYLPPGHYVFRVTACNNDQVWNQSGASLTFAVLPQFWQTWWFQGTVLLGAAGTLAGAVRGATRRRMRRRVEQLERQRALERERSRIARDIHDDLGASLTRITLLSQSARSELDDSHQAATEVDQIYTTARELTRAMDEIVWAVNPKHDTLDSLVTYLGRFAQSFVSSAGLRCRLDVPVTLPSWHLSAEVRHNLFLALKEALHNVLKHAGATEVRVILELYADGFVLTIIDNGRGFTPGPAEPASSADSTRVAAGNGLANMRRRLEEIHGQCEWQTAPGEGTRVKFTVPIKRASRGFASSKDMTPLSLNYEV